MFSIWINGILSSLHGYSAHNTDFLALVKVLLTYIWRWLGKFSSSSFYSACGDRGLKQIRKFFSNKCHIYSLLDVNYYKLGNIYIYISYLILSYLILLYQNEGKSKVFFERDKEGWYRVRLPQITRGFLWN